MPLKTKITQVPERYQQKLREHNFKGAETWAEKIKELGRDERGRIKPLLPKDDAQVQPDSNSDGIPARPVR